MPLGAWVALRVFGRVKVGTLLSRKRQTVQQPAGPTSARPSDRPVLTKRLCAWGSGGRGRKFVV